MAPFASQVSDSFRRLHEVFYGNYRIAGCALWRKDKLPITWHGSFDFHRCLRQQKRKLQGLTGQTLHPIFHVAFCFVFLVVWGSETFRLRKWRRQVAVAAVFGRAVAELPLLGESHSAKARRGPGI